MLLDHLRFGVGIIKDRLNVYSHLLGLVVLLGIGARVAERLTPLRDTGTTI